MASLSDYYQTLKDLAGGKISVSDVIKAAKDNPGGVISGQQRAEDRFPDDGEIKTEGSNYVVAGVDNSDSGKKSKSSNKPEKYDSRGRITDEYKKYRDSQNNGDDAKSAAKEARSLQEDAQKEAERLQKEADEKAQKEKEAAEAKIRDAIDKGYENTTGEFDAAGKSLDTSSSFINDLGKTRDRYLGALDSYKQKTSDAITGNKKLIERNQKKDLDALSKDTGKSMDNTNVMLGIKGASGGSASKAASRAIATSAGKQRRDILTDYGDETKKQNQSEKNALDEYDKKRKQAYDWETTAREQALADFNEERDALDRLKNNKSGWKEQDIKALSDRNLNNLMTNLKTIQVQGKNLRDNLAARMSEESSLADALEVAAVDVNAPSELDAQEFNANIDLGNPENAEDLYDPNVENKQRVIKGYDALGNPIYADEIPEAIPTT